MVENICHFLKEDICHFWWRLFFLADHYVRCFISLLIFKPVVLKLEEVGDPIKLLLLIYENEKTKK